MADNNSTQPADALLDLRDSASSVASQLRALTFLAIEDMDAPHAALGLRAILRGLADQLDRVAS